MICNPVCSMRVCSIDVFVLGANTLALKSACMHMSSSSLMVVTMSVNVSYPSCLSAGGLDVSSKH
jgi:hypothetical protein